MTAAFAGRERSFRPTERVRVVSIFLSSGIVLGGCGALHTLAIAGVDPTVTFRLVSIGAAAFVAFTNIPLIALSFRVARDPDSTSEPWALNLSATHTAAVLTLLVANGFVGGAALLSATFWLQLLHGLWMFTRVLTRAN